MPRNDRTGLESGRTYAPEPLPLTGTVSNSQPAWHGFFKSLVFDTELVVLTGFLFALCGWFMLSLQPAAPEASTRPPVPVVERPPLERPAPFTLVASGARDWLLPAMLAFEPRQPSKPLLLPGKRPSPPEATASVEQHALVAEPLFDGLGSVILTGLPPSSRLSAGAELSEPGSATSEWAVAFGDLDNLVIELPRHRNGPIRTTLDLRTRAGLKIASLSVELRDDGPGPVANPGPEPEVSKKSKVRPAKSSKGPAKTINRAAPKTATGNPVPVYPGDAPKAATAAQAQPTPTGGLGSGPLGLFKPDPKDSATSGLAPELRDDPRFTTLRGLGMAPEPSPNAAESASAP